MLVAGNSVILQQRRGESRPASRGEGSRLANLYPNSGKRPKR